MSDNTTVTSQSAPPSPKRRRWIALAVIVVLVLILPVSNLFIAPASDTVLADLARQHPDFGDAAAILQSHCLDCHGRTARKPLYGWLPVARGLIERDAATASRYFDMDAELVTSNGTTFAMPALAKIEYVLEQDTMPPTRYVAMHWNLGFDANERYLVHEWIRSTRQAQDPVDGVRIDFKAHALQPLPRSLELDHEKVALGDALFHDVRLSKDNTLSCASCHALDKGGTDQERVSTGVGDAKGPINAPTVYNAVFNFRQFWDGRAADLQEQAGGPVTNPKEMGATWEGVVERLSADDAFVARFRATYPEGLSQETITDAIAEFEKSLVTTHNRFDAYLYGDDTALSADELAGLALFRENACANCHNGRNLGGLSYERMGRRADYFADRGHTTEVDLGRFNQTNAERDRFAFKVPTLRNVELTFPYFHDGTRQTLEMAVSDMARYQGYRDFSAKETAQVVAFLKTLTGEQRDGRVF